MEVKMKIVILDGYTENPGDLSWKGIEKLGELTIYDRTAKEEIISRIGDAEIIITNKTPITAETFAACPNIQYVGVLATGFNVVDLNAAKQNSVVVTNIPTYGTSAVAQYVFALLLEICHHVGHHAETVKDGRCAESPDFCYWDFPLIELYGKTIGIIGYGRIGQATAKIAVALGMKVLAYNHNNQNLPQNDEIKMVNLDELLEGADIISLHCPLVPSTQGMINKDTIAKMKDGVILINTSRGPLIVEEDLKAGLDSGKIYAAGLDVVSVEPIKKDNVLLTCKNCLITPHIAWAPVESRQRLMDIATENLESYIKGSPVNVVNK